MTDKQMLEEVYRMVANGYVADIQDDVKRFIEQEWQKADDQELVDQYNRNRKPEDWIKDVSQIVAPPPSWEKEEWYNSFPAVDDSCDGTNTQL